jgi:hypothetical protein
VDEFSYDLGTGDPQDSGDGVGKQNEQVAEVPPCPNGASTAPSTGSWAITARSVRVRWIDEFELQFNSAGLQTLHGCVAASKVDAITYVDLNYKYTFDNLLGDGARRPSRSAPTTSSTSSPIRSSTSGGIETFVHDVRVAACGICGLNQDLQRAGVDNDGVLLPVRTSSSASTAGTMKWNCPTSPTSRCGGSTSAIPPRRAGVAECR